MEYIIASLLAKTPKLSKHTLICNIKIIKSTLNTISNDLESTNTDTIAFNTDRNQHLTRKANYCNPCNS
ncbi:hypothetical protein SDC9_164883 [bioreactor metagenome]|uniref:Uncharacterized protein n=1 Tax=bioreactor metagenome TaxID=1076179 RepID=A0A645FVH0_9ZZZZ